MLPFSKGSGKLGTISCRCIGDLCWFRARIAYIDGAKDAALRELILELVQRDGSGLSLTVIAE